MAFVLTRPLASPGLLRSSCTALTNGFTFIILSLVCKGKGLNKLNTNVSSSASYSFVTTEDIWDRAETQKQKL